MLKENSIVKVHIYGTDGKEINTNLSDIAFTVYKKTGKLGIDWNVNESPYMNGGDRFTPFETFTPSVEFENIDTGCRYYFCILSNRIKEA